MRIQLNLSVILVSLVAFIGILQFFSGVAISIRFFADAPYSMSEHFLSDLGRLQSWEGRSNRLSADTFNPAVIRLGLCFIPFFVVAPRVLDRLHLLISTAGVISTLGLISIGLTPYDKYFVLHHVALAIWIGPMLVAMIAILVSAFLEGRYPLLLSVFTALVVLASLAFTASGSHTDKVVFQKVLAVFTVAWFAAVTMLISFSVYQTIAPGRKLAEEQAEAYLEKILRRHKRH